MIKVQDSTSSGKSIYEAFELQLPLPCTLRELIRVRVREEVARHNASHSPTYQGLVCPDGALPTTDGFRLDTGWRRIDWERQADIAEQAFERNGFFVFVRDGNRSDYQLDDLDELIDLPTDAELQFVRLVHLVGG
jgi:hypothetical protein